MGRSNGGNNMNVYLTPEQVCEKLQISLQALYQLTSRKQIPCAKVGRRLRFDEGCIDRWFRSKQEESEQAA
jgi:excisionase family DNA binding protein